MIRVGRSPVVLLMNDASLYTLTIPATGLTSYTGFVAIFLALIDQAPTHPNPAGPWRRLGGKGNSSQSP